MILDEEIKKYLPKYLSDSSTKELLKSLGSFPDNIQSSLYTTELANQKVIFQGDGLLGMTTINLPDPTIGQVPALIFSNTCDIDLSNERAYPSQICYAPILKLNSFLGLVEKKKGKGYAKEFIDKVKKQYITQIVYLPIGGGLTYEGIVFLDRINNFPNNLVSRQNLRENRLFSLSNYGLYLLLLKLSIHFSRIQEGIDRNVRQV
jgi:hypothetical protein